MPSHFEAAHAAKKTVEVPICSWRFVIFPTDGISAIGTRNLGGSTAIVLASPRAAIVAHLRPELDTASFMNELLRFYKKNDQEFPQGHPAFIICARKGEAPLYPQQVAIIQQVFRRNGLLVPPVKSYEPSGQGTVFVDARPPSGQRLVPVENRVVAQF
ncbi:hypothetical protein AJ80_05179 [Polytolypa hystricis UAMH7299]|uniref:Uncharacterized protein n=1 Tax=Polytolypa hystricis (strain UAMH7299) TaxID=1447883 RepID=A0A2B7XXI3_POLH7|nr:hypothetical protein AJ80_05179 [Polytolypa hystricis UAMH7299]